MQFKHGDRVVYPNHGIGVIEDVEEKQVDGQPCHFYLLRILANDTVVMIPTNNAKSVGLRRTISLRDVTSLLNQLREGDTTNPGSWKGRYKENSDRMRTGSIFEVAAVLKNLSQLSQSKSLSYREKRMLDKARQLVASEIAEVKCAPVDKITAEIDSAITAGMGIGH